MAVYDSELGRVVVRVVYDGPGFAGKTTNLRRLEEFFTVQRRGELLSPETAAERTQFFDWMHLDGGLVLGHRLRCQLMSVPGQDELAHRRRHLLSTADAVVFVVEGTIEGAELARPLMASLDRAVPIVLQINKIDLSSAVGPSTVAAILDAPDGVPMVTASAVDGIGVRETVVLAIRAAASRVQARVLADGLGAIEGDALTPEQLLDELRALRLDTEDLLGEPGSEAATILSFSVEPPPPEPFVAATRGAEHDDDALPRRVLAWPAPSSPPPAQPSEVEHRPSGNASATSPTDEHDALIRRPAPSSHPPSVHATAAALDDERLDAEGAAAHDATPSHAPLTQRPAPSSQPSRDHASAAVLDGERLHAKEEAADDATPSHTPLTQRPAPSSHPPGDHATAAPLDGECLDAKEGAPDDDAPLTHRPAPPSYAMGLDERPGPAAREEPGATIADAIAPATSADQRRLPALPGDGAGRVVVPRPAAATLRAPTVAFPSADAPSGFIWPALHGRDVLKAVHTLDAPERMREHAKQHGLGDGSGGHDLVLYKAGAWCLKTSRRRRYVDPEEGRAALVSLARAKHQLGDLLPPDSVLCLQRNEDGSHSLWTVSPWLVTARAAMRAATEVSDESALADELVAYAAAAFAAANLAVRRGAVLDVHPSNFGRYRDGPFLYLDDDIERGRRLPALGHALLHRVHEYGAFPNAVARYVAFIEDLLPSRFDAAAIERLGLIESIEAEPPRSPACRDAQGRWLAVLARQREGA